MYESVQGKKLKASRIMKIIIVLSETMKKIKISIFIIMIEFV